jgi:O-antigen ligase
VGRLRTDVLAGAPALGVAVVVGALGFAQGGFLPRAWVWSTVLLAWIGIASLLLEPHVRLDRIELAWVGLVALLAGWTLLSTTWSASPGQSVLEARRDLVYVAGTAAVALCARRSSAAYLLVGLWTAATVVVVAGLVRYLAERPGHVETVEGALLFRPVGYANGLAALAGMAILLGGGIAAHAGNAVLRAAAAASLVPLAAALTLTESRGAWLALAVGAVAGLALERRRTGTAAALVPAAALAGIAVWLAARSRLTSSDALATKRQCALLGIELAALALAAALAMRPRTLPGSGRRLLAVVAVLALAAIVAVALARHDAGKGLGSGYRRDYWRVAWHEYTAHPVLGSGAGTFGRYWALNGPPSAGAALDAHSLYLETLAELGPLGLLLVVAALVLPLTRAAAARAAPLGPATAGAYVAFVVHAAADWDWELAAVTLCGLACGGAILVAGRRDGPGTLELAPRERFLAGAGLAAVALLALAGLLSGAKPGL